MAAHARAAPLGLGRAQGEQGALERVGGAGSGGPRAGLAGAHAHGTARPGGAARERLGEGRLLEQGAGGEDGEAVGAHPARHRARGQGLRETRAEVGQELVAGLAAVAGVVGREALDVGADEDVTGAGVSDQKSLGMREEARARLEAGEGVSRAGGGGRPLREPGARGAPPPPVKGARGAVRPCAAASVSAIAAPPSASRQMIPWRSITRDARIAVNPRIAERGVSPWEGGRGAVGGSSLASRNILRLRA